MASLQYNRFSVAVKKLFLAMRKGSDADDSVRIYSHSIQRWDMGNRGRRSGARNLRS